MQKRVRKSDILNPAVKPEQLRTSNHEGVVMAIKYGRPIEARLAPVENKLKPRLDLASRPRRNRKAEWTRRLVRGTNGPDILCDELAKRLRVPSAPAMLLRRRNTLA